MSSSCIFLSRWETYKLLQAEEVDTVKSWIAREFYYHKAHFPPCIGLLLQPGLHAINRLFIHLAHVLKPIGAFFKEVVMCVVENNSQDHSSARALF